jgi:predicted permease
MGRWLTRFALRCRSLVAPRRVDAELDEELQFHLARHIEAQVSRGVTPEEARRQAVMAIGGLEQQKDACRDTRGVTLIDHVVRDMRYAARMLRGNPGFTLVAIFSLALGIGANTAIFQLIEAVRLRSLPVPRAGELTEVRIAGGNGGWGVSENENSQLTLPLWEQIREEQRAFSGIFAWGTTPFPVGSGPDARRVAGLWVSGEAFQILGVTPAVGRLFGPADDQRGCSPTVVLNDAFWRAQFGGDPSVIGRTLTILDRAVPIIGVTAPEFFGLEVGRRFDIALPTCAAGIWGSPTDRRDYFWLSAMGRLRDGWTVTRAAEHLDALSGGIFEATSPADRQPASIERYRRFRITALPASNGVSSLRTTYAGALWLLLGMTGLVLLIACTNLMNLLLARASAREHEIGVRLAIGASRARVISQLLTESMLLAVCGAALGIVLAPPLSRSLVALLATTSNPLDLELRTAWPVLAFACAVGLATCVLFGLVPAFRVSRTDPGIAMKTGGRGLTANRDRLLMQRCLVTTQVAISLVLLFGAALFVRSFRNLITLDTGLRRDGVIFAMFADFSDRPAPEGVLAAQSELLERIRSVPHVDSAAITTQFPLNGSSWTQGIELPASNAPERRSSKFTYVSPKYFSTIGMRLLAGRDFDESDTATSRKVALVNETFVRRHFAGANPIGGTVRTVAEPRFPATVYEIIGVASDTKYSALREPIPPITFVPIAQHPSPRPWPGIVIRSSASPSMVMATVKRAVGELRPNMTMGFTVFDTQVRDGLARERILAWLAGGFGVLAAVLAMIGVYGVISYLVVRRRHEIAIRLALGAGRTRVVRLILREIVMLLVVGLVLGAALAVAMASGAGSLLFGLSPRDPGALVEAAGVLATIGFLASSLPAFRASRVDATAALRSE